MAGCHCHIPFITTSIVAAASLLIFASQVDASATLELLMVRYDNPSSRRSGGRKCDYGGHCDHVLRFALDRGNSSDNPRSHHYWAYTTGRFKNTRSIEFDEDMRGVANPIVTSFAVWPIIGVKFKVFVKDRDTKFFEGGDDDVDEFVQLLQLTPALNVSIANWTNITMHGLRRKHKTSLTIEYTLYCDANYYTSDCSVYCIVNDTDADEHYTCDPDTGSITCSPGWEDESTNCVTLSDDCLGHTCLNGATCVDGVRTYTCLCPPGYTGDRCETDVNECASNPCKHNGTCEDQLNGFTCHCPPGFTGNLCSDVHQPTNDTVKSTAPPLRITSDQSDNEANSSQTWLYVVLCVVSIVLLGALVLVVFLYIRKRKQANGLKNQLSVTYNSSSGSSSIQSTPVSLPSLMPEAAAAASFCVVAVSADEQASNALNHGLDKFTALSNHDNSNVSNVYESIDNVPNTSRGSCGSSSSQPTPLAPSPPAAAAAASANIYDSINDVSITSQSLSASSPEAIPPPETAQAPAISSVCIHPTGSTDYMPMTPSQLPPSTPAAAVSFSVDVDDVCVQASDSTDEVPCLYQLEPNNTEPSDGGYVNCVCDVDVDVDE